jgi:pimeloyl-ACP methyl ester carboxylesterase
MLHEELQLPSKDGVTQLRGVFALPSDGVSQVSALLIVPGGWFAEREGFVGDSYTEADFMFRRIALGVLGQGVAVVRYDNRGVSGNELTVGITKISPDPLADTKRYLSTCIDPGIRATVTPESLMEDTATFYDFLASHPLIDSSRIVVFAHSEGGLHVARLINDQRIAPIGVIFAGSTTSSPVMALKWQVIDRYVAEVMSWDRTGDGSVDTTDVALGYPASFLAEAGISQENVEPNNGSWTEEKLYAHFTSKYERDKYEVLAVADEVPFPLPENVEHAFVAASHRWMKQWYRDERSVLSLLRGYTGKITFHFGGIDRQYSAKNETDNILQNSSVMDSAPKFVVHKTRGHAFGSHKPVSGPMDKEAEEMFVREIVGILEAS